MYNGLCIDLIRSSVMLFHVLQSQIAVLTCALKEGSLVFIGLKCIRNWQITPETMEAYLMRSR